MRFFSRNFLARSRCLLTSAIPAVCLCGARGRAKARAERWLRFLNYIPRKKLEQKLSRPEMRNRTRLVVLLVSAIPAKRFELFGRRASGQGCLGQFRAFAERAGDTGSHQG